MHRLKISEILIGLVFTLLFLSIAVIITINFRPLYYFDIKLLHIVQDSGLPKDVIKENYDALINYSSPFYTGELVFPTLSSSEHGLIHFAQVKNIFTGFYLLGMVTLTSGIIIIIRKAKNKDIRYLLVSSVMAVVLPIIFALFLSINFDRTFILFHKLFFHNDYWLFDPDLDPVITILPDTFFMHCALMIIVIIIFCSLIFLSIYLWKKQHTGIKYRRNTGLKL